ncbi:class II aldolase/adducin family protein [Roseivirga sp.]|uniref:class II aldolase/adducin family protein n=1 Tax=Roseivirga sp. TaxID=1964215 RepID=UPI003B8C7F87
MDDGYIKFELDWKQDDEPLLAGLEDLLFWRNKMYDLNLIGHDDQHNVGFGNISQRVRKNQFVISGTQTGHIEKLSIEHYTTVVDYDIQKNSLKCLGPVKASSESLTHAAIYEVDPSIKAIIHIHHDTQWNKWLDKVPTTDKRVPYGTPEMALEIHRLFRETPKDEMSVIAMAGHQGGLISFGESHAEAAKPFLEVFQD